MYSSLVENKLHFVHPEMCVVFGETGGDTSQGKDGQIGNEKYMCPIGTVPTFPINTKNIRFTVVGVTLLDDTPRMCVITIQGTDINN